MDFREFIEEGEDIRHFYLLNFCTGDFIVTEGVTDDPLHLIGKNFFDSKEDSNPKIAKSNALQDVMHAARHISEPFYKQQFKANVTNYLRRPDGGSYDGFQTLILHLLPNLLSGFQVCACSTPQCRNNCLHFAGSNAQSGIKTAGRLKRTWSLVKHGRKAVDAIGNGIANMRKKAEAANKRLVVRLNGTSDLEWEHIVGSDDKNLMARFSDVPEQNWASVLFYDYTKNFKRFDGALPENYKLVYSRAEGKPDGDRRTSDKIAIDLLSRGYNVAIVFGPGRLPNENLFYPGTSHKVLATPKKKLKDGEKKRPKWIWEGDALIPRVWNGFPVISGDHHDLRFLEMLDNQSQQKKKGIVIGLTAKGPAIYENYSTDRKRFILTRGASNFVVQPTDPSVDPEKYPENREYYEAAMTAYRQKNGEIEEEESLLATGQKLKYNRIPKSQQYGDAKTRHIEEIEYIIKLLNGDVDPRHSKQAEEEGKGKKVRRDEKNIQNLFAKIEKYYRDHPEEYQQVYMTAVSQSQSKDPQQQRFGQAHKELLDKVGDRIRNIEPVSGKIMKRIGITAGKYVPSDQGGIHQRGNFIPSQDIAAAIKKPKGQSNIGQSQVNNI